MSIPIDVKIDSQNMLPRHIRAAHVQPMRKSPAEQRRVDLANPEPGYFLVSLVPGGWPVGAQIYVEYDCVAAVVDGVELPDRWPLADLDTLRDEATMDGRLFQHPLFRILLFGEPCDEIAYRTRLATKVWAIRHCPDHPCLWPDKPYTPNHLPALDF
jgi:hypothetical protein